MVICIGTLNAWTLASSQIAHGAHEDNLFPKIFGKTTKSGAPVASLLLASIGTVPFLLLERLEYTRSGVEMLVDILTSLFLVVYLSCCFSYAKLIKRFGYSKMAIVRECLLVAFSSSFCIFILFESLLQTVIAFLAFVVIGMPVYFCNKKRILRYEASDN
jgi:APA family basic amino acid/polyamine antiporter